MTMNLNRRRVLAGAAVEAQDSVGHFLEGEAAFVAFRRALRERRGARRNTQQKHGSDCAHECPPHMILDLAPAPASTHHAARTA